MSNNNAKEVKLVTIDEFLAAVENNTLDDLEFRPFIELVDPSQKDEEEK